MTVNREFYIQLIEIHSSMSNSFREEWAKLAVRFNLLK